jgi:hypothetical protein
VRTIFNGAARDQRLAVYAVDLACAWATGAVTDEAAPLPNDQRPDGEFLTFHADWDLPPHGNVTPDADGHLPAPETDARDTIHRPEDPA